MVVADKFEMVNAGFEQQRGYVEFVDWHQRNGSVLPRGYQCTPLTNCFDYHFGPLSASYRAILANMTQTKSHIIRQPPCTLNIGLVPISIDGRRPETEGY